MSLQCSSFIFFFNDTATTEIYTLSLHDALPICTMPAEIFERPRAFAAAAAGDSHGPFWFRLRNAADRKSTRLNSSHGYISYAVICLKQKNITLKQPSDL